MHMVRFAFFVLRTHKSPTFDRSRCFRTCYRWTRQIFKRHHMSFKSTSGVLPHARRPTFVSRIVLASQHLTLPEPQPRPTSESTKVVVGVMSCFEGLVFVQDALGFGWCSIHGRGYVLDFDSLHLDETAVQGWLGQKFVRGV